MEYAVRAVQLFGDQVKMWATFNEPAVRRETGGEKGGGVGVCVCVGGGGVYVRLIWGEGERAKIRELRSRCGWMP